MTSDSDLLENSEVKLPLVIICFCLLKSGMTLFHSRNHIERLQWNLGISPLCGDIPGGNN